MTNARLDELNDYPFQRLRNLLDGVPGGGPMLNFALGEPQIGAPKLLLYTASCGPLLPAGTTLTLIAEVLVSPPLEPSRKVAR